MTCDTIQEKIISTDGEFDEAITQHIESCSVCRNIASEWDIIRSVDITDDAEVPQSVEFAIKSEAVQFNKAKQNKNSTKFIIFIATAACFVIAIWGGIVLSESPITIKSTTPTVVKTDTTTIPSWDSIDMTEDIMEFASTIEINDVDALSQLTTSNKIDVTPSTEMSIDNDGFSDDVFLDSDDDILLISDSDGLI